MTSLTGLSARELTIHLAERDQTLARIIRLHPSSGRAGRVGGAVCRECGNPWPCQTLLIARGQAPATTGDAAAAVPTGTCACGHSEVSHDLNDARVRTKCLHFYTAGQCPCRKYTPREER